VVAPPLGGVLFRISNEKRPPRNGGRFSCCPAASGA
jgi:hypothetical protein